MVWRYTIQYEDGADPYYLVAFDNFDHTGAFYPNNIESNVEFVQIRQGGFVQLSPRDGFLYIYTKIINRKRHVLTKPL